jgi:radical SAM superfamily enzyme
MTRDRGIHIGAHLIAGFPTETRAETLAMADEISQLSISFLKIHQLQVIKNTPLAETYRTKPFPVFSYDEYLDFVTQFIERTAPHIVFQRLFATAPDDILVAPEWGKTRHHILRDIEKSLNARDAVQGRLFSPRPVAVRD